MIPNVLDTMFTGIIEGQGTISRIEPAASGRRIRVDADFSLDGSRIGDSIATSGACLTAVAIDGRMFEADLSPETLSRSTFGNATVGDRVNLERALRLSDRLDGHLVLGHLDGVGTIVERRNAGNAQIISIRLAEELARYLIPKGSVAVDGISLTVNTCRRNGFEMAVIPHTAKWTTIGVKPVGAAVNIETDLIGKYVERFLAHQPEHPSGAITRELLEKSGFIPS